LLFVFPPNDLARCVSKSKKKAQEKQEKQEQNPPLAQKQSKLGRCLSAVKLGAECTLLGQIWRPNSAEHCLQVGPKWYRGAAAREGRAGSVPGWNLEDFLKVFSSFFQFFSFESLFLSLF